MGNNEFIELHRTCNMCKKHFIIKVPTGGFYSWIIEDNLIQNALPDVSPEERELLISGICGNCYNELFNEE